MENKKIMMFIRMEIGCGDCQLIADFPQIFLVFPSILFYGRSHNPPREKI
jgi:hypothetical protein